MPRKDKLVRITIALPASLKEKMQQTDTNWSEAIREMIAQRLEEGQADMSEAVILNEMVRRKAPKNWSGLNLPLKRWRRGTGSYYARLS